MFLRALEPEDLELLYQIENQPDLWQAGVTNVPYSRYVLREFIRQSTSDIYRDGQVRLMAENERHEVVGIADLVNFSPTHLRAELGLVILPQHRHQGYASQILPQLCSYARDVLHLHQLYSIVDKRNSACTAMFARLGIAPAATLPGWLFDGKDRHDAHLFVIPLTCCTIDGRDS